jgi:hypothetical protein
MARRAAGAIRSRPRSTREVFEDHLRLRRRGRLEEDLARSAPRDRLRLSVGPRQSHLGRPPLRLTPPLRNRLLAFLAVAVGTAVCLLWPRPPE